MYDYEVEQEKVKIGGVEVGGRPGERPTALVGTVFYRGHKIVIDESTGEFDRKRAEQLISEQDGLSDATGNPGLIDVVGASKEAIVSRLAFAADATEAPILLDAPTAEVRIAGLTWAEESGLLDRVVYNSLTPHVDLGELEAIREAGLKNAVFLALNPREFTAAGRLKSVIQTMPTIREAGVTNLLVDTCVLDIPSLGLACWAMAEVKNKLGLPAGCGAHNAISTWRGLRAKFGEQAVKPCVSACMAATAQSGADFILYGPIEDARYVFPAVAMVDTALSQIAAEHGRRVSRSHPRYRIA